MDGGDGHTFPQSGPRSSGLSSSTADLPINTSLSTLSTVRPYSDSTSSSTTTATYHSAQSAIYDPAQSTLSIPAPSPITNSATTAISQAQEPQEHNIVVGSSYPSDNLSATSTSASSLPLTTIAPAEEVHQQGTASTSNSPYGSPSVEPTVASTATTATIAEGGSNASEGSSNARHKLDRLLEEHRRNKEKSKVNPPNSTVYSNGSASRELVLLLPTIRHLEWANASRPLTQISMTNRRPPTPVSPSSQDLSQARLNLENGELSLTLNGASDWQQQRPSQRMDAVTTDPNVSSEQAPIIVVCRVCQHHISMSLPYCHRCRKPILSGESRDSERETSYTSYDAAETSTIVQWFRYREAYYNGKRRGDAWGC